jgi:hypothetical protein
MEVPSEPAQALSIIRRVEFIKMWVRLLPSFSVPVAAQESPLELVFQTSVTRFRSDGWETGSKRADEKRSPHDEVP